MTLTAADKALRARLYPPGLRAMRPRAAHAPYYKVPTSVVSSSTVVAHTAAVNTVVGNLSCIQGPPPGISQKPIDDTFTYSIVAGNAGNVFKIVGATLQVAAALSAGNVPITIRATGVNSGATKDTAMSITVT